MVAQGRTWRVASTLNCIDSVDELQRLLLQHREVQESDVEQFFAPTYEGSVGNPFDIYGMSEAVDRLLHAAKKNEHVLVWGDYDADGVSGTAVVVEALQAVNCTVAPYLPHRSDEGYGLNKAALEGLLDSFDILVTVDCGGSNSEEIAWLVEQKKDVIVVDHHELPKTLPPARSILHPRHPKGSYATTHLSGAGVGWKLAQALLRQSGASLEDEKWLMDLPLLGTLADSMPLVRENRAIVRFGLQVLQRTRRHGLRALLAASRMNLESMSARDVVFRIVPALNAAGRMDHPQAALDLLLAKTPAAARAAAENLVLLNNQRRQLTSQIVQEAKEQYDASLPVVFAFNTSWPVGIVGIVAGQLAEKFNRPAVIVGGAKHAAVGSARSYGGIDIHAALMTAADHTLKLGGHKQAAGFSLEEKNLTKFRDTLIGALDGAPSHDVEGVQNADAIVADSLVSWKTLDLVQKFEPFGEANREPTFILKGVTAADIRPVGKTGKHLKARLVGADQDIAAIGFSLAEADITQGQQVDVMGTVKANHFNGSTNLQFQMTDIAPTGSVTLSS